MQHDCPIEYNYRIKHQSTSNFASFHFFFTKVTGPCFYLISFLRIFLNVGFNLISFYFNNYLLVFGFVYFFSMNLVLNFVVSNLNLSFSVNYAKGIERFKLFLSKCYLYSYSLVNFIFFLSYLLSSKSSSPLL